MSAETELPEIPIVESSRIRLEKFKADLKKIINKHSMENFWDMPDFLMADMITSFITHTGHAMKNNLTWHDCASICHPLNIDD